MATRGCNELDWQPFDGAGVMADRACWLLRDSGYRDPQPIFLVYVSSAEANCEIRGTQVKPSA